MNARPFEAAEIPVWAGSPPAVGRRLLPSGRGAGDEGPGPELWVPELRGSDVEELCHRLRASRRSLLDVPVREVIAALGRVGSRFLDPDDSLRREALALLPPTTGLSPAMCRVVLDGMARDWTTDRLEALVTLDLGDPDLLDGFVERPGGAGRVRALAPGLSVHVCAGSVPGVSATSLVRALLAKGPVLVKPGRGDVVLPVLFLRALARDAPELARSAAVLYWPGGAPTERDVEETVLGLADRVVAYGGDAAIRELRARLPVTVPLRAYHHRMSLGIVGRDGVGPGRLEESARLCARSVAVFDQRGCVSPHAFFVEGGDEGESFAGALAAELDRLHREIPPGRLDDAEASALHQARGMAEMLQAADAGVRVWSGGAAASWTVVLDPAAGVSPSCLNRFARVVPVGSLLDVPPLLAPRSRHLQTVGVVGVPEDRLQPLAEELARYGVLRIAPMEDVPFPPPWWHHDGEGPLRALLDFVGLEPATPPAAAPPAT